MSNIIKPVPGFPAYKADPCGSIYSLFGLGYQAKRKADNDSIPRKLKPFKTTYGYCAVNLYRENGKPRMCFVHDLVLLTFVGERPPGGQARHLDGNKENNNLCNLRWGTARQNSDDRIFVHCTSGAGSKNSRAILNEDNVKEIRDLLQEGGIRMELAAKFGVSVSTIGAIRRREVWGWLQ